MKYGSGEIIARTENWSTRSEVEHASPKAECSLAAVSNPQADAHRVPLVACLAVVIVEVYAAAPKGYPASGGSVIPL
jgi:hypothetical protein